MRKHKIRKSITFLFAALLSFTSGAAKEVSLPVQEMMDWSEQQFADAATLPLSFLYDGESSDTWLPACRLDVKTKQDKQGRIEEIRTYTDQQRKIEVRCEIVRYTDYPAVEWTVYVKNNGKTNTGIFENLMALDLPFTVGSGETVYLNYNVGGASGIDGDGAREFQPLREKLDVGRSRELGAFWAGFPTAQNLPFFNIERKEGTEGVIAAVGWPARWKASFARTADTTLTAQVGQIHTRFYLEPGEEVRTPLVVLMFWQGNREGICPNRFSKPPVLLFLRRCFMPRTRIRSNLLTAIWKRIFSWIIGGWMPVGIRTREEVGRICSEHGTPIRNGIRTDYGLSAIMRTVKV